MIDFFTQFLPCGNKERKKEVKQLFTFIEDQYDLKFLLGKIYEVD